jgi:outer membrane protein TolC
VPELIAQYATYRAFEADLSAINAKDKFDVSFEARLSRPFAESGFDSKESIGLVLTKKFDTDGRLENEKRQAESLASGAHSRLNADYQKIQLELNSALQKIESLTGAITMSEENINAISDEIQYLRQQLVIGASTLDTVLSAEARLYDAKSKHINFEADRAIAQLNILSGLGLLSKALEVDAELFLRN